MTRQLIYCVFSLSFFCKDAERFSFSSGFEEGRDRCPYDPAKGYTGLIIGRSKSHLFSSILMELKMYPDNIQYLLGEENYVCPVMSLFVNDWIVKAYCFCMLWWHSGTVVTTY